MSHIETFPIAYCSKGECHAPMIWIVTSAGSKMPLDEAPIENWISASRFVVLFEIDRVNDYGDGLLHVTSYRPMEFATALEAGHELRSSHFATCAYAGEFSRKGKGRRR